MLQFISPNCVLFRPKPIPQYFSHPELVQGVWGTLICSTEHGVSLRPQLSLFLDNQAVPRQEPFRQLDYTVALLPMTCGCRAVFPFPGGSCGCGSDAGPSC
jgi:hypothetical protein